MFKQITPKPDFIQLEKKLLKWWYQSGLVKKYLRRNDKSKKRFSFLDGPITANNPMGVHHAWGRTLKDLFQRYKNMQGFKQRFQNGFDNQGLWVEVEVEKDLGFKSKKDIEKYGIAKFVNKCKKRTLHFSKVQTEQSKRLGYFMDWDNSYYTMSDENNYMIWSFLKKCWQDGNLYKGKDSVPWCPRCGTAISQHEILQEEYQELTHDSIYFKLPIISTPNSQLQTASFLVWTTTPWTIPGNVALAVNPDFIYGAFKKDKEVVILVKDLKTKALGKEWQLVKKYKGKELKGWQYEAAFDDLASVQKAQKENPKTFHRVVLDEDLVTASEGTGLVHLAPGAGQEDFQLGKKEKLSVIEVIEEEASYVEGFGELTGKNAKQHPELIINYLKEKDKGKYFFKTEPYTHRYPVCWRCKTELVWRVVDEWYIAMDDTVKKGAKNYRQRMMKATKKIRWIPQWGLERELDWLRNMQDWLVSKKRYWGLALPIWECQCGHFEVIGSKEELKEGASKGWKEFEGKTPHRPWIDKVKIKCPQCGKLTSRIPDVGNPWLDAGIVSFSTLKYRSNKKYWRKWFPADFITENFHGQFKNWFYSLIAMSTVLKDKEPFKTVLAHALVQDEKGEEMHKSKGNAIEFNEAAERMGVDVMRWLYLSQNPANNLNFGYHLADETRRRFHLLLWNIYSFFVTYANVDKWQPHVETKKPPTKLDQWILTRLDQTLIETAKALDDFDTPMATSLFEEFIQDLSTWYIRRSRDRVGPTAKDKKEKDLCHWTLYTTLFVLIRALAPFLPYLSEEIYQNLIGKGKLKMENSVHLADWPEVKSEKVVNQPLLENMRLVRQVCEKGHAARKEAKIGVRQPLQSIKVGASKELKLSDELVQLIKEELNVKRVEFKKGKGDLKVDLDTKITPQLKKEGEDRELIRQIQELRKENKCRLDEKINVITPRFPHNQELVGQATLAESFKKGEKLTIKK